MRLHSLGNTSTATRFIGLQFQLPGCNDVITASGEVITGSTAGACGVRFTRMPAVSAARLGRFLAAQ